MVLHSTYMPQPRCAGTRLEMYKVCGVVLINRFLFWRLNVDWFELSYKGREAGLLMLQLTYYSHVSGSDHAVSIDTLN